MKNVLIITIILLLNISFGGHALAQNNILKLVFIRHGEKPDEGDNLNCMGLNRSLQLPSVLFKKFGKAAAIYVPALNLGKSTSRSRMFQTISPYAVKYNLPVNTKFPVDDADGISQALLSEKGVVVIVWEHNSIVPILKKLGIKKTKTMDWPDGDFDSIYVVTFPGGKATINTDKEGIKPAGGCSF